MRQLDEAICDLTEMFNKTNISQWEITYWPQIEKCHKSVHLIKEIKSLLSIAVSTFTPNCTTLLPSLHIITTDAIKERLDKSF
ncbi:MAG: hypothetical protein ABSG48_07745 [Geobacteraceae bacterium]|jgi:hypothetical protein